MEINVPMINTLTFILDGLVVHLQEFEQEL